MKADRTFATQHLAQAKFEPAPPGLALAGLPRLQEAQAWQQDGRALLRRL